MQFSYEKYRQVSSFLYPILYVPPSVTTFSILKFRSKMEFDIRKILLRHH